jgi:aspartate/methionine/tyrosine aminotransferase
MNNLLSKISAPAAIQIADSVRTKEALGEVVFKLQTGEPCFDTPQYIKEGLNESLALNQTRYSYSQGLPELRNELSRNIVKKYNIEISQKQFFITNGAVSAIQYAIQSIIEKGNEVLIFDPSWPQYSNITAACGGTPKKVSTRSTNFIPTLELIKSEISDFTKLIIFNNPNNPSGAIIPKGELDRILYFLKDKNIFLMFDEVYDAIVYKPFYSIFESPSYPQLKEKVIYINSFSKTFCMTGWRLGYAVIPKVLTENYLKLIQNSITSVATFIQWSGVTALQNMSNHASLFEEMLAVYRSRRDELEALLKEKCWTFHQPEGSFYFFIQIPKKQVDFVQNLLEKNKIAVVPGIAYGENFQDFFRISYAVDDFSYNGFINWLKNE